MEPTAWLGSLAYHLGSGSFHPIVPDHYILLSTIPWGPLIFPKSLTSRMSSFPFLLTLSNKISLFLLGLTQTPTFLSNLGL